MITVDPQHLNLRPGQKVLDLGCGEGRHSIHLMITDEVDVYGIDLCLNDVRTASERAEPLTIQSMPKGAYYSGWRMAYSCLLPMPHLMW